MNNIWTYLAHEHYNKKHIDLDMTGWTVNRGTTGGQRNGHDCGVFTSMYCDFVANGDAPAFSQQDMRRCRTRMALSILKLQHYARACAAHTNDQVELQDDDDMPESALAHADEQEQDDDEDDDNDGDNDDAAESMDVKQGPVGV